MMNAPIKKEDLIAKFLNGIENKFKDLASTI